MKEPRPRSSWIQGIAQILAGLFTDILLQNLLSDSRGTSQTTLPSALRSSWSPHFTTNKPSGTVQKSPQFTMPQSYLPPPHPLPHHNKPHFEQDCWKRGGNIDRLDNHSFIYTSWKKLAKKNDVDNLCYVMILSWDYWATLPMRFFFFCFFFMYIMYYIFKSREHHSSVYRHEQVGVDQASQSSRH